MSTQGIIEMRKGGVVKKSIYYDADGYPEGVMPEIQYFANMFFTNKTKANESLEHKYDTDYLYKVSITDNKIIVKTYYVSFKGKLSFLETISYTKEGDKLREERTLGKQYIKDNMIEEEKTHITEYYKLEQG